MNELLKNNITPVVTLSHFDHPQVLENNGGWLNEITAYAFRDYARVVFKNFGDKIKYFVTFNEPYILCMIAYGFGALAPGN